MIELLIHIDTFSKPRGQLGKHGKMTHSLNGYREWQQEFIEKLRKLYKQEFKLHSMAYVIEHKRGKGGLPDATNLEGAVEDALVKGCWIRDDNISILNNCWRRVIITKESPKTRIFLFDSHDDLRSNIVQLIDRFK